MARSIRSESWQGVFAQFGCVLADAGYGMASEFRAGLSERGLLWAVGVLPTQSLYSADVELHMPERKRTGRPPKHPIPSEKPQSAQEVIEALPPEAWRTITWRRGTKGPLSAKFVAVRVRPADGPWMSRNRRLPGTEVWLVCEQRANREIKYYLANHSARASLLTLARLIQSRWSCEQAHQQMKEELGLDHYEGRSWTGLHHHALLSMIALSFLQYLRLGGEKAQEASAPNGTATQAYAARGPTLPARGPHGDPTEMPALQASTLLHAAGVVVAE
jgi:SRSO17 transposase